jgi:hypothetical protein
MSNPKDIKILPVSQVATKDLRKHVDRVLEALGHSEALVTDKSLVRDFLSMGGYPHQIQRGGLFSKEPWEERPGNPEIARENEEILRRASEKLGLPLEPSDLIITVAHKLKNLARS